MVEDSAPFSELPPVSLIVQSSRVSPRGGKLSSHCLREACLTGESLESPRSQTKHREIFVKPIEMRLLQQISTFG